MCTSLRSSASKRINGPLNKWLHLKPDCHSDFPGISRVLGTCQTPCSMLWPYLFIWFFMDVFLSYGIDKPVSLKDARLSLFTSRTAFWSSLQDLQCSFQYHLLHQFWGAFWVWWQQVSGATEDNKWNPICWDINDVSGKLPAFAYFLKEYYIEMKSNQIGLSFFVRGTFWSNYYILKV